MWTQGRAEAGQLQARLILVKLGAPTSEATRPWPLMTFLHTVAKGNVWFFNVYCKPSHLELAQEHKQGMRRHS